MKYLTTKNTFFTGTLLLTTAGILTRIIGFFYRIFLSRTIGAEGLGIYQLIFPVMALCFSMTAAGIQTSISKYVSMEIGNRNPSAARTYLVIGLVLSTGLSLLLGIFLWRYADFIAVTWLGEARCAPLLKIISFSYVPCGIHSCINGYYYGMKKAAIPSLSQLVEQIVRVGSVYLIYLIATEKGQAVTISMAVWGILLGEIGGMLVSLSAIKTGSISTNLYPCLKNLMHMAIPLTANRIVLNLFSSVENIMIPSRLRLFGYTNAEALSVYGVLTGMAYAIILFPTVITNSVSVLLLPTISEAQAKQNHTLIVNAIKKTTVSCLLLGFLSTLCFLATGNFIGNRIFHNALAGTFITTICWICPFLYLSSTINSILHGLGYPSVTFFLNLLGCSIRILFVLFVVPAIGIKGYLTGLLLSQILISILAFVILCKKVNLPVK